MRPTSTLSLFAIALAFLFSSRCAADQIADTFTNQSESGGLAGSSPDLLPGSSRLWKSYWYENGGGGHDILTTSSATYASGSVVTPVRGAAGTTFTVNVPITDNGAYISVNPGAGGLITAKASVTFSSTSGNW